MKTYLILLASGTAVRFGAGCPKQFVRIGGKMIIEHTMAACDCGLFDEIVLVVSGPYIDLMKSVVGQHKTPIRIVEGGVSRKESCKCGVAAIRDAEANVVVHNGVQPFVSKDCFERCLAALDKYQAVTSGVPCVYTVLKVDQDKNVADMPNRADLYNDMGVECFKLSLLRQLFEEYDDDVSTDIIGMIFRAGLAKVHVVEGDSRNIKITRPEDMVLAAHFLTDNANGYN